MKYLQCFYSILVDVRVLIKNSTDTHGLTSQPHNSGKRNVYILYINPLITTLLLLIDWTFGAQTMCSCTSEKYKDCIRSISF